jgi:transposase InsO family protein
MTAAGLAVAFLGGLLVPELRLPQNLGYLVAGVVPFRITHVPTDRGSCFTTEGFETACPRLGVQHCTTKPYIPQTNGMVERFNGRVGREALVMWLTPEP